MTEGDDLIDNNETAQLPIVAALQPPSAVMGTDGGGVNMSSGELDVDEDGRDHDLVATPSAAEASVVATLNEAMKPRAPAVVCLRTGIPFLSSDSMCLLPSYDDGLLSPQVAAPTAAYLTAEPVFCRICREGLHDDADDEQPTAAEDNEADEGNNANNNSRAGRRAMERLSSSRQSSANIDEEDDDQLAANQATYRGAGDPSYLSDRPSQTSRNSAALKGPVLPHPVYAPNALALENPLLAPCECSGSMAFVHYLCIEQWRCRSRHPAAENGLSCETCGSRYSLPPPSSRPANVLVEQQAEDWLDAMPPHVMQALRNPHIMWQIGTAVVRRRWLRPLAPILMSPIVALYCRARRLLKKRGVARRRWACSLCRRRARWKCVRCLRSYYCSRHCQNVAWHIIHKHVCYKPIRLWWSTVVYGALCLITFPGILRDPLMYDLGLFLLPFSFIVIGILAGGIATCLKKSFGLDLRGRLLELTVVLLTLWLTSVSWGLVKGFFGQSQSCHGSLGRRVEIPDNNMVASVSMTLYWIQRLILDPARSYYLMWDRLALSSGNWLQSILCLPQVTEASTDSTMMTTTMTTTPVEGCFEFLPHANANFFVGSHETTTTSDGVDVLSQDASKCAADLLLVWYLYVTAAAGYVASALLKHRERRQRRQQQQRHQHQRRGGIARPHQD